MRDRLTRHLVHRRVPRPLRPLIRNPVADRLLPRVARHRLRRRARTDPGPTVH